MNLHRILMQQEWQQCRAGIIPWLCLGFCGCFIFPVLSHPLWACYYGCTYALIPLGQQQREIGGKVAEFLFSLPPTVAERRRAAIHLHGGILLAVQSTLLIAALAELPQLIWTLLGAGFCTPEPANSLWTWQLFFMPLPFLGLFLASRGAASYLAGLLAVLGHMRSLLLLLCGFIAFLPAVRPDIFTLSLATLLLLWLALLLVRGQGGPSLEMEWKNRTPVKSWIPFIFAVALSGLWAWWPLRHLDVWQQLKKISPQAEFREHAPIRYDGPRSLPLPPPVQSWRD